jgi:hypothetical protein
MRRKPQLITIQILLEAKNRFFGPNERPSRHKRNVLKRMAFSNVFIDRATTTNLGSVINRDHSTIVYYNKQHEWHFKYCKEYIDLYNAAKAVFKDYDTNDSIDSEYINMDNAALLNQLIQLKDKVYNKDIVIVKQEKQLESLRVYYRKTELAKKSFPNI